MKVVFKKDPSKKYTCDNCDKQFNWNKNSIRYGKQEYKTVKEQRQDEKIFCSNKCNKEYSLI